MFKVVKACIDQDTKKRLNPGDLVAKMSDFEKGRHLAEGNIIPFNDKKRERSVKNTPETKKRRLGRKKKNDTD